MQFCTSNLLFAFCQLFPAWLLELFTLPELLLLDSRHLNVGRTIGSWNISIWFKFLAFFHQIAKLDNWIHICMGHAE